MTAEEMGGAAPPDAGTRSMWDNFRDVVLAPSATFEDVGRYPRWLAPLLVVMALTVVTSFFLMPMSVEMQKLAMMKRDMPADQREQALNMIKWGGLVIGPIIVALFTAIYGLFFWAWAAISGAKNATFRIAFTALIYAGIIILIQSVAQAVVVWVKGAEQVALEGAPTFGLALFMDKGDMSPWMWALISDISFFTIWHAVVVGIAGIYALRMSKGVATTFAIAVWLLNIFWIRLQG